MRRHTLVTALVAAGMLAACSESAPPSAQAPSASAEPVAVAATPTDEASLRRAAASALSEQRFYAPAGDNALEHYLALRRLQPDDLDLATALLELLPYALIASEQAVARGDFPEAGRLLALIEKTDPQAPSLARLRENIVVAEAAVAQRVIAEAEAEKRAALQAEIAAETAARARETAAALPAPIAPATASPAPVVAAPLPSAAASIAAPPVRSTPASAPSSATPRLLSAPPPRYPLVAMRRKIEGNVTVQFTIQADGSVASPSVVSADPPGVFDQAALAAARGWRFETGARPVSGAREVRFRLAQGADVRGH